MSSQISATERIERAEDLDLPPEAREVFGHLTEDGSTQFSQEIIEALWQAQEKGNLRPVKDVVDAWYRSLLIWRDSEHQDATTWAKRTRQRSGVSLEELRDKLVT